MEVELAPGYTWLVAYRWDGEEPEIMLTRAISVEKAIAEAHFALDTGFLEYQILGLVREDQRASFCRRCGIGAK